MHSVRSCEDEGSILWFIGSRTGSSDLIIIGEHETECAPQLKWEIMKELSLLPSSLFRNFGKTPSFKRGEEGSASSSTRMCCLQEKFRILFEVYLPYAFINKILSFLMTIWRRFEEARGICLKNFSSIGCHGRSNFSKEAPYSNSAIRFFWAQNEYRLAFLNCNNFHFFGLYSQVETTSVIRKIRISNLRMYGCFR